MNSKKCTKCNQIKNFNEYYIHKLGKYGLTASCKSCHKIKHDKYHRTKLGLLSTIYRGQKHSSKTRGHTPPSYTLSEFRNWALCFSDFHLLFDNWILSNFDKWSTPSFDRLDDSKKYSFDNFNKWMTWKENKLKGEEDIRNGIIISGSKPHKPVSQFSKTGVFIENYVSCNQAERETNISNASISSCCLGGRKLAGGYIWRFNPCP